MIVLVCFIALLCLAVYIADIDTDPPPPGGFDEWGNE